MAATRALLRPLHEVIEEDTETAAGSGPEISHHRRQVVHAVEPLDHHPLVTEVVAPDLLDQLGVVHSFDEDPAGASDAGPVFDGDGPRCGHGGGRRLRRRSHDGVAGHAVDGELAGADGEGVNASRSVTQAQLGVGEPVEGPGGAGGEVGDGRPGDRSDDREAPGTRVEVDGVHRSAGRTSHGSERRERPVAGRGGWAPAAGREAGAARGLRATAIPTWRRGGARRTPPARAWRRRTVPAGALPRRWAPPPGARDRRRPPTGARTDRRRPG